MLEGDVYSYSIAGPAVLFLPTAKLSLAQQEDPALVIADSRYQSIRTLCNEVSNSQKAIPNRLTELLDKVILSRWLGMPIFLLVIYLMFLLAINIGGSLQRIFDIGQKLYSFRGFNG